MSINTEYISCPRCSSKDYRLHYTARDYLYNIEGEFFISECNQCGLWYQNPRPLEMELSNLYPSSYGPHQNKTERNEEDPLTPIKTKTLKSKIINTIKYLGLERVIKFLLGFVIKRNKILHLMPTLIFDGNLLEIGCAEGSRLIQLKKEGWGNLYGIELSEIATQRARSKGLNVECGMVENILNKFPDNYFDVVISSMVIEHLLNPFTVVDLVTKKLKPGGYFLFSTINRKSLDAKIYKKFWAGFDLPRHMVYFSQQDIKEMLKADYQKIKIYGQIAPIDFIRSSQWRFEEKKNKFDIFILRANTHILNIISFLVVRLGLATRISISCRKKW